LLSNDYVDEMTGREPLHGKVEITAESKRYFAAFPDYHREYLHLLESGDFVTAHWRMTGTNTANLTAELPATGKTIDLPGCTIFEVRDGLIVHAWLYVDRMIMFGQLGLM
jgi:predicted ester cyclase